MVRRSEFSCTDRLFAGLRVLLAVAIVSVVGACASAKSSTVKESAGIVGPPNTGSLWADSGASMSLFQDTKAARVGDVVTVHIVENAKGTKDAGTKTGRTSALSASAAALFGAPNNITNRMNADASFDTSFDGSGSTSRSGALTADITTVVTDVLPNGNLKIEGHRDVTINREKETITLSGIIRPEDIGPQNTVLSTYVAEAVINYSGNGVLNDKQRPGWAMRILDWIWPF